MIWLLKSIFLRYREHNGCQGWFMDRCHAIENWGSAAKPRHLSCHLDIYAKSMHYRYRCIVSIFHLYIVQFINKHISVVIRSLEAQVARAFSTLKIRDDLLFDDIADEVWWVLLLDPTPFFPWKTYPIFWTSFLQNPSLETKLRLFLKSWVRMLLRGLVFCLQTRKIFKPWLGTSSREKFSAHDLMTSLPE